MVNRKPEILGGADQVRVLLLADAAVWQIRVDYVLTVLCDRAGDAYEIRRPSRSPRPAE